jgi:hypothetical protein
MSKRYKAKRRARYYRRRYGDDSCVGPDRCWCGVENPYYAPQTENCGGTGSVDCRCGGDLCVCHNHGEVECFGCPDCEQDEDDYGEDSYPHDFDTEPQQL